MTAVQKGRAALEVSAAGLAAVSAAEAASEAADFPAAEAADADRKDTLNHEFPK